MSKQPVRTLLSIVKEFAKLDAEMPIQQIIVFLHIAGHPGITITDLSKVSGISKPSVSRNVAALGRIHRTGKPGHNLIETLENTEDHRLKRLHLTPRGMLVYNSLLETLGS